MSHGKVHVIGAGLAGLSAAVRLASHGASVVLSEAAAQAGGRCRSYFDPQLDQVIDNGNHLVLSGNQAVHRYLRSIGAEDRLAGPDKARFDFQDLRTGERWTLRPNEGPLAWWVLAEDRRVPGTRAADYLGLTVLLRRRPRKRVDQVMRCEGVLWERLMRPFLLAALNTEPEAGSADLAGAIVRETLARGGKAYRPRIAEPTLGAAFVEPALVKLEGEGAEVRFGRRLRAFAFEHGLVSGLDFGEGLEPVETDEAVVLAVPPWTAQTLLPKVPAPDAFCAIVNGHFKVAPPPGTPPILGIIGGTVEWIFAFEDRISVTVSGADAIVDLDREVLAQRLWADVAKALDMPADLPPWQVVKEKRATFAATPEQNARRPGARTPWANLFLAGDWTRTGLPATIEGALRSGETAARLALRRVAL